MNRKCILAILLLGIYLPVKAQIFDYEEDTLVAQFRIDLLGKTNIEGIYLAIVPTGYDGRAIIGSSYFEEYFSEVCMGNNYAFMSCSIDRYDIRDVLFRAIEYFAIESGQLELLSLPIFLNGISGSTVLVTNMVYLEFPERTIGYIISSGYCYPNGVDSEFKYKIPALWAVGELNEDGHLERVTDLFYKFRGDHALWTLAVIPGMGHERTDPDLVYDFLAGISELRYQPGSASSNTYNLIELSEETGWLGNNNNFVISSYDIYPYRKEEASWLAGEQFAHTWQEFISAPATGINYVNASDDSEYAISNGENLIIKSMSNKRAVIMIYDLYGRKLYSGILSPSDSEQMLDLQPDKNQVYIISICTDDKTQSYKFCRF